VYSIDGKDVFLVHNYLTEEESQSGSVDRDSALRTILGVEDPEYEIVSHEDCTARRLVADRLNSLEFTSVSTARRST